MLTLERLGYARATAGRFALTPKVLALGYADLSSCGSPTCPPADGELTAEFDLRTARPALAARIVYIDRILRGRVASINLAAGTRLPHAPGRSTSAGLRRARGRRSRAGPLPTSPIDADGTRPRCGRSPRSATPVRSRDQELEIGRRSGAVPVFDGDKRAIAALALSCGTLECSMDQLTGEFLPPLQATARAISEALAPACAAADNYQPPEDQSRTEPQ